MSIITGNAKLFGIIEESGKTGGDFDQVRSAGGKSPMFAPAIN
jgi:hypothetical protein